MADREEEKLFWREEFRVRSYEINSRAVATMETMAKYIQEVASNHARAMKLDVTHLSASKLTWVLSRIHIKMDHYPQWQQKVIVETWPAEKDKYFAIRDYRIFDENYRELGAATSSWMLINLETRRPAELPEFMEGTENKKRGRALHDPFDKLPVLEGPFDYEKEFHVRLSDLDVNQHVNFINYIGWGLETVPQEIWENYVLKDLQIGFRAESVYGDSVLARSKKEEKEDKSVFTHRLEKKSDGSELTRLVSQWQKPDK